MTPRGQTWTSHCEQLVQNIFIMFYRREYGTTACHRFSAVPSVLYHKEPCLHSQSPPHPFHLGFAALSHYAGLVPHFLEVCLRPQEEGTHLPSSCWKAPFPKASHHLLWSFSRVCCLISGKSFGPSDQIAQEWHDLQGFSGIYNSNYSKVEHDPLLWSVVANLICQHDYIWNLKKSKLLGTPVRDWFLKSEYLKQEDTINLGSTICCQPIYRDLEEGASFLPAYF